MCVRERERGRGWSCRGVAADDCGHGDGSADAVENNNFKTRTMYFNVVLMIWTAVTMLMMSMVLMMAAIGVMV